jgi:adenine-specific DNA methylase
VSDYPKRLIEVDLPIKKISAHARREKSIRHGHISTLHIWWARRPLAACRAVLCAALWPDPADPLCPQKFRDDACRLINEFSAKAVSDKALSQSCSHDTWKKWQALSKVNGGLDSKKDAHWNVLRFALLDFIADFANWDNSAVPEYLETSRALTQSAHEALGGVPGTRPLVVDPFAGGGSIPLEALRVGADVFASDLNPIPVLLNKVVLEYVPKYGQRLADEVRKWGEWIKREAEKELAEFYPNDADGATPIAYLWARTIQCEGPGCGAEVPLIRSFWLSKKANRSVAFQLVPNLEAKRVDFKIIVKQRDGWVDQANPKSRIDNPKFDGTVKRGSATCLCCGYTTPVARVREQLKARRGGTNTARLFCIVTTSPATVGRIYRRPTDNDLNCVKRASDELAKRIKSHTGPLSLVPDEPTPMGGGSGAGRAFSQRNYGMNDFADLFTARQLLALSTLTQLVQKAGNLIVTAKDKGAGSAVQTCLALALSRLADRTCSLCTWRPQADQEKVEHVFTRQALPMTWDFAEGTFLSERTAGWNDAYEPPAKLVEALATLGLHEGSATASSATAHPLPDDAAQLFATDPPYYDAVPYSDLSDFFFVWLKRCLPLADANPFSGDVTPKTDECIVDEVKGKDAAYFEATMKKAMAEGRRVLAPNGIGIVVFAHKSTAGWEAQLQAMIEAGWIMTGSWPIDTEMGNRLRAMDSAALASSVHLVCRPRENPDASVRADEIGDWRDVLQELPRRIHEWMPRLAQEGVVGADAIFSCLGPALEIFSRYSRVEKPNGDQVTLKEYLEYVWAAVSKEAISMIFAGADTTGFEEDARLTAMWLWTLSPGLSDVETAKPDEIEDADGDSDEKPAQAAKLTGFTLEYDAARKIAQGLGAHLELLVNLVEVKGETARLLPVVERTKALFGKEGTESPVAKRKKSAQLSLPGLLEELEHEDSGWTLQNAGKPGSTTLDRLHQAMILFAAGRGEGLRRFLVDDGVGKDQRFWSLAQSLCALYPSGTDERRWSEGVLARKKGLGL